MPSPEARRLTVPLSRSDQAVDVLLALREAGIGIESVAVAKPSLDEVFLALTGHDTHDGRHHRGPTTRPRGKPDDHRNAKSHRHPD